ncbi:TIR domain-containing protein [Saccharospirillum impatiens]|uniref:TIR domain-containing protein n=1 Tax=Saccharospirillum impatiens TaxID=169438 RepID=UPI00048D6678|nr:TIR domain-containing protein [Saccharospirillum impatiens]
MGGSGGGWNSLGNIRALEEKAKAALQGGKRNVFISFAAEDIDEVNLLRGHAKNENSDIEFNDHSVRAPYNSEQAEYIKRKIAERISRSSTTVVYLSNSAALSQWVEWEVSKSIELGKRVIAVHPGEKYSGIKPSWVGSISEILPWSKLSEKLR